MTTPFRLPNSMKGDKIRFCKGKYENLEGWLLRNGKKYPEMVDCIVQMHDGEEELVRVRKSSVKTIITDVTSKFEAVVQQHPEIENAVDDLMRLLAQVK